jgi:hypothetical protein
MSYLIWIFVMLDLMTNAIPYPTATIIPTIASIINRTGKAWPISILLILHFIYSVSSDCISFPYPSAVGSPCQSLECSSCVLRFGLVLVRILTDIQVFLFCFSVLFHLHIKITSYMSNLGWIFVKITEWRYLILHLHLPILLISYFIYGMSSDCISFPYLLAVGSLLSIVRAFLSSTKIYWRFGLVLVRILTDIQVIFCLCRYFLFLFCCPIFVVLHIKITLYMDRNFIVPQTPDVIFVNLTFYL